MSGWFRVDAADWPAIAESLMRPWPDGAARIDLRWYADRERLGLGKIPSRRQLVKRWGWTDWRVRSMLRSEWQDPRFLPSPSQVPPKSLPTSSQHSAAALGSTAENLPTASQVPPKSLPNASTRAFEITDTDTDTDTEEDLALRVWRRWRDVAAVDGTQPHKRARKLSAKDRSNINARIAEWGLEAVELVIDWAHKDESSWYYQQRRLGIYTLTKPQNFDQRLADAERWRDTRASSEGWARVLELAKGGWASLERGDPYRTAAKAWGQLTDRSGPKALAIRRRWEDATR